MSKKFFVCLLIIFLSSHFCLGQKWLPGYIITNEFDTINGYINLQSNYNNSRFCEFRQGENSEQKSYNPDEIRGYRIENIKFYVARKIKINGEEKTVFLEYLVNGIVDLYYLTEIATDYYFIEKDGVLNQLSNEERLINVGGVAYKKES